MRSHAPSFASSGIALATGKLSLEAVPPLVTQKACPKMAPTDGRLRAAVGDHLSLVWRVLRRTGLGAADAEDASQDVFWILAQRLEDVPERAQRSFLVSTALRVASDRKLSRWHRSVSGGFDVETRVSEAPLPDEALDRQRAAALLDRALDSLEPADRAVFILAELEQMTRTEVADALGIPEGTVASRLRRARDELKAALRRLGARSRSER